MPERKVRILRLLSVALTRDKQVILLEELRRYSAATNWVIKIILKNLLRSPARIKEAIEDTFVKEYDNRAVYLDNVIVSARAEIAKHTKLAMTIRSMREKTPFFRSGRLILSQPIIKLGDKAVVLKLLDRTEIAIPYDKRSRNRLAPEINAILRGEPRTPDTSGIMQLNKRYERIRLTWNNEGFVDIDIRAFLPENDDVGL
ncbi:MAG: hypothetical protein ACFFCT_14370 [Candidatus Odinarchaeota archaeon]